MGAGGKSSLGRPAAARRAGRAATTGRRIGAGALLPAAILAGLAACAPPEPPPPGAPRLVLLLVVDQMRADYLSRFGHLFQGGLRQLLDRGVVFTEAHHDHAATLTAPGHASLASGCHPSRHGVIGNYWFERGSGERGYSVEDEGPGKLLCSTLGDWLKRRYRAARVYAASQKDRSAVMLAGREADGVFWYDWMGGFHSSRFYARRAPEWLAAFNEEKSLDELFGEVWSVEPLALEERERLGIDTTRLGPLQRGFPHAYGGLDIAPGESFYRGLYTSPALDDALARLAVRALYAEGLGEDEIPDLLALGFSGLDAVGHRYGPESREVMETVLALDRALGRLLAELDEKIGLERMVVALSSDHGAVPVPELRAVRGLAGERVGSEQVLCLQRLERRLDERLGAAEWLLPGGFLNREALAGRGLEPEAAEALVRREAEACPAVARVWTRSDLTASGGPAEEVGRRFANSFHADRSPDFQIQWDEYFVISASSLSTHGSPYRYDTWVPLILLVPGRGPALVHEPVRTVDLAPTLAALAGVEAPAEIDGRDLGGLF